MQFALTQDFPSGLDRLWDVFGTERYVREKYLGLGAAALRVLRFHADADRIEVELEREIVVDHAALPAWARPLVGARQTLHHRSRWQRTGPAQADAEITIAPLGMPVRARGAGSVAETAPASTRLRLAWQVESSLPLLGRRVESLFAGQVRAALDDDHRFTLAYLRQGADGANA